MDKNKIVMIAPVAVAGILMLGILAAITSTNQAFAADKKPTKLTLAVQITRVPVNERVPITISGRLWNENNSSGIAGATISFSCDKEPCGRPVTTTCVLPREPCGHYSVAASLSATPPKSTSTIEASTQKVPDDYEKSEASLTVPLCENPPGYWSFCGPRPHD